MSKATRALAKTSKYVYLFGNGKADGDGTMKPLLGGKGANLAEMSRIGLPFLRASPSRPRSARTITQTKRPIPKSCRT
jgi:hypothetical protein